MARRSAAPAEDAQPQSAQAAAPATPPEPSGGAAPADGHAEQLRALQSDPDPFASAFGIAPKRAPADEPIPVVPTADEFATTPAAPAPEKDEAAPAQADGEPDPFAGKTDDEIADLVRRHPRLKRAADLYTREHLNKQNAETQRLRAQQQQAAEVLEMQRAFADPDHPKHWDAVDYWARRGIAPVQQSQTEAQLFEDEDFVGRFMQHHGAAFDERAVHAAILAAADHPDLSKLGLKQLEDLWQESDGSPADFYARAFEARGYLSPAKAEAIAEATRQEERTRLFGEEYPAPDVSPGEGDTGIRGRIPTDKAEIDPYALLEEAFSEARNGRRGR